MTQKTIHALRQTSKPIRKLVSYNPLLVCGSSFENDLHYVLWQVRKHLVFKNRVFPSKMFKRDEKFELYGKRVRVVIQAGFDNFWIVTIRVFLNDKLAAHIVFIFLHTLYE